MSNQETKTCKRCGYPLPVSKFRRSFQNGRYFYQSYCLECEKKRDKERAARRDDYDRQRITCEKYGITVGIFNIMLEEQKGLCAICSEELKKPNIDHCHLTGKVRGLLCTRCNSGIGYFDKADLNWLEKAFKYLGIDFSNQRRSDEPDEN